MKTAQQQEAFNALCLANGLGKEDVWQHKQSGQWIIARTGIEKIQGHNNIGIDLQLCAAAVDFAVVKATAERTVRPEGAKTGGKKISIQSLGSANAKNSQVTYYAEMAEKRAKSRAILQLMGFYALGVYGEDEADDFKRTADAVPVSLPAEVPAHNPGAQRVADLQREENEAQAQQAEEPAAKPEAVASAPASTAPAPAPSAAPSAGLNVELESVIQAIIRELRSEHITPIERNKMMMAVNTLTLEKAQKCLANLRETVEYRPSPDALAKARTALRSFANANAAAIGTREYNRLHLRAGALTATTVDLIAEQQAAEQSLKAPAAVAA